MVTVNSEDNGLITMLSPFPVQGEKLPESLKTAELHSVIEVSSMTDYITQQIAEHIKQFSGAALFIDYGYNEYRTGETLQAVENHKYVGIYDRPGFADLSAHVNFKKILDIATLNQLKTLGPVCQGNFLSDMGIAERVKILSKSALPDQRKNILTALNRLVSPEEMGTLFKVAAMISNHDIEVAGF